MANYFYVKNGGTASVATATATTDPTTKRTSTWSATAADHFPDIATAFLGDDTVAPVNGDYIIVSDAHTESQTTIQDWFSIDGASYGIVNVISVDNANQDTYSAGGTMSSTADIRVQNAKLYGLTITLTGAATNILADGSFGVNSPNCYTAFVNSTISCECTGIIFDLQGQDGCSLELFNCTIDKATNVNGELILLSGGASLKAYDTNFTVSSSGAYDSILDSITGSNGSGLCVLTGCDLSVFDEALAIINSASDAMRIEIIDCILHSAFSIVSSGEFFHPNQSALISGSDDTKADGYAYQTMYGIATSEYTIARAQSSPMTIEDNNMSIKVVTTSDATVNTPFVIDFPASFSDLSTFDTISIFCAGSAQLTDADVKVEILYRNTTSNVDTTSTISVAHDPLATGTNLTLDTDSIWTGSPTNKQLINVTTTLGIACVPIIRIYVYKPSATIYFDTETYLS